jgi:hypothetical protein
MSHPSLLLGLPSPKVPSPEAKLSNEGEPREGNEDFLSSLDRSPTDPGGFEGDLRSFLLIRLKLISMGLTRSGLAFEPGLY